MKKKTLILLCVLGFLLLGFAPQPVGAQSFDPQIDALLENMSPEERIGQLFIVTFFGTDASADVAELIRDYHVGGVMLKPENNNFTNEANLPVATNQLIRELQSINRDTDLTDEDTTPAEPYVPLFIAADVSSAQWQALTEVSPDLTPIPSQMAIGATWEPQLARTVGVEVGEELSAIGVNLVFGPSADVVVTPPSTPNGDLGTHVFGGDPYWVGEMTAAYIEGIHEGAASKMLVAPRHFPGYGAADRLATEEIPSVQRTFDQLNETDLVPFYRVTTEAALPTQQADAVVVGHISFRGLQVEGSAPVSLDPNALNTLLTGFESWRGEGGLIISDALGLDGVLQEYGYQPSTTFPNRAIALDAFEAGNDVLYLGNFGTNPPADQRDVIVDTLDLFLARYEQDVEFRERVDEAARRIISKKIELYGGSFDEVSTLPPTLDEDEVIVQPEIAANVANASLSLISPAAVEQLRPPQVGERIVIFSDIRSFSQCTTCTARSLIGAGELQSSLLRLYGPQGSNEIGFADISSYTFDQLEQYLEFGPGGSTGNGAQDGLDDVAVSLDNADWVIFVTSDENIERYPAAEAVSKFLSNPPVTFDTRLVVFAAGAPYYLDATEVSKLTAFYAVYDTSSPFIDVAATALFRPQSLNGDSPVSVPAVGYDIQTVVQPNPDRVIQLTYGLTDNDDSLLGTATPAVASTQTPLPQVEVGDEVRIQAVIRDHNGRLVKDGTPVNFLIQYVALGTERPVTVPTVDGVAEFTFVRDEQSLIVITATSPPAVRSVGVRMDDSAIGLVTPQPTVQATQTVTPTETPEPTAAPPEEPQPSLEAMVSFGDLFFTMMGLTAISVIIFTLTIVQQDLNAALLLSLPGMIIGLVAYNYYALGLPGSFQWRALLTIGENSQWAAGSAAWFAALITFGLIRLTLMTINLRTEASR